MEKALHKSRAIRGGIIVVSAMQVSKVQKRLENKGLYCSLGLMVGPFLPADSY